MASDGPAARVSATIFIATLLGAALLWVLWILLGQPVLAWLALLVAAAGIMIMSIRFVRALRQLRRTRR